VKLNEANFTFPTVLITFLIIFLTAQSCSSNYVPPRKEINNIHLTSLVLSGYGSDTYQIDSVQTYLNELRELGANTASFLYTCHVDNINDSDIDCDSFDSPRLDRLSDAIKLARTQNFIVSLRVYIDVLDEKWRCYWNPENKKETFRNIKEILTDFAIYSEEHKLELFILGAEYCKLTGQAYTKEWLSIIKEVRSNFQGKITYGANWGPVDGKKEWKEVGFWKELDFIGIDHYQPLPDIYNQKEIVNFQKQNFFGYQRLARTIGKPLMLTELGFPGHEKGHLEPFEWRLTGRSDEKRQATNFKATLVALGLSKQFSGVLIWRKASKSPEEMLTYDKDALAYELYHRKAWYEIQQFFKSY
jgi:hypothetical protein